MSGRSRMTVPPVGRRHMLARILVASLALTVWSLPAGAETVVFYGGLNRASLNGDADEFGRELASGLEDVLGGTWTSNKTTLGGLVMGAGYRNDTRTSVGMQLEVQYIQRGTRYEMTARNVPDLPPSILTEVDLKLTYLEAIALVHYSPKSEAKVRPALMAGPVVGLKMSSDLKVTVEGESASDEISDGVAGMTLGLVGGAGLAFQMSESAALTLQARYYLGLTDLLDSSPGTAKSGDLSFLVGVDLLSGS